MKNSEFVVNFAKMDKLSIIQQIILRDFGDVETNILSATKVLHVWTEKSDSKGLFYFPNFHLIFQSHNEDTFTVKLVTFHGKTVDSLVFKTESHAENEAFPQIVSNFVQDYTSGFFLCPGVAKSEPMFDYSQNLIECLNDNVIVRSQKCKFSMKIDDQKCEECAKLIFKIKTEPAPAPIIQPKIELEEGMDKFQKNM